MLKKIEKAYVDQDFGYEILLVSYVTELLVIINNNYKGYSQDNDLNDVPDILALILEYIDFYLNDDLSLAALENKFNINRFYLSRI